MPRYGEFVSKRAQTESLDIGSMQRRADEESRWCSHHCLPDRPNSGCNVS